MMKYSVISVLLITILAGCKKDSAVPGTLEGYISQNSDFTISSELIACAMGGQKGFMEDKAYPTSVFFYPIPGACEFRYFESETIDISITEYSKFNEKKLQDEPVFNGYLWRFKNRDTKKDVWGIVTYKVGNVLHICRAIHIKLNSKPSQYAPELVNVSSVGIEPLFTWEDGSVKENAIYFQVISDTLGNLISGTYTYDKYFKFYDTTNVVLNIHNVDPAPLLNSNTKYNFTLMGVSYDNWVNLVSQNEFVTQ
ncbi:MAG: hypothetical protein AB7O73_04070 [Bacteroidia bacterium]